MKKNPKRVKQTAAQRHNDTYRRLGVRIYGDVETSVKEGVSYEVTPTQDPIDRLFNS